MMKTNEQVFCANLVEAVKKHPCLYNYLLPQYSMKNLVEKAWAEVGAEVNEEATACKEKWRNIRTVFVRNLKSETSVGSNKRKRPYYLNDMMQFILPFVKSYSASSNTDAENSWFEIGQGMEDYKIDEPEWITVRCQTNIDHMEPCPGTGSEELVASMECEKRKVDDLSEVNKTLTSFSNSRAENRDTGHEPNHPTKLFLLGLLPELYQMNDQQIRQFKRRVMLLIDDIFEDRPQSKDS